MSTSSKFTELSGSGQVVRANLLYLVPICLVVTLGGLLFGYDTGVISGAIELLTAKFGLSDFMKGWSSGCVLIGCATGVLLVGLLSDRFGRRPAMFLAAVMFLISAIGTALSPDIWSFIVFRIIGGIGIGIASISTPMYIAEITPAHIRGRMVAVNQIAIVGGMASISFINYAIAHSKGALALLVVQAWLINTGWRWMFATGIFPSVLFGLLLLTIPESPRWLIEKGHSDTATRIMTEVAGCGFAEAELNGIKSALSQEKGTWGELFSRKLRVPLFVGVFLAILQQITGINVFLYFGATIFKSLSASTGVDAGLLQQLIINGACLLFTVIAIAKVDKWGRKPLMLIGAMGMGASLIAMGIQAQYITDPSAVGHVVLIFILLYIGCFGLSVGPVTWVILSEIYPTAIRGRALGLATFFLWLADYVVTQTFPIMNAKGSWFVKVFHHAFPFYLYAAFCVALVLIVWLIVPETKGRSLEEIEQFWHSE